MLDALELGNTLVSLKMGKFPSLNKAIEKYERELFPRVQKFAQKTVNNMEAHFSADGLFAYLTGDEDELMRFTD
ncbi:hypothetical protein N7536_010816 [Penicillium majusculum]|nr:hypothetical protein N7536_010816 [Penicillium majusculum]